MNSEEIADLIEELREIKTQLRIRNDIIVIFVSAFIISVVFALAGVFP